MIDSNKDNAQELVAAETEVTEVAKGRLVIRVRSALSAGRLAAEDCKSVCDCHSSCDCKSGGKVKL